MDTGTASRSISLTHSSNNNNISSGSTNPASVANYFAANNAAGAGRYQPNDDSTFIVNQPSEASANDGMRQRIPISDSDFNHMFSPLPLERMFQRSPSRADDGGNTENSASITGLLWKDSNIRPNDDTIEGAGNTLRQLLSNGSNPNNINTNQQQQQQQRYSMTPEMQFSDHHGALISPSSPPETVASLGSVLDDMPQIYSAGVLNAHQPASAGIENHNIESIRPASALPPLPTHMHRRSVQIDPRRLPPIPSSPHLRSSSRVSMLSPSLSGTNLRRGPASANEVFRNGETPTSIPQLARHSQQQLSDRYAGGSTSTLQRSNSSSGGYHHTPVHDQGAPIDNSTSHPLQVHSAIGPGPGPGTRQQADLSLRHEVLDKVARQSQPSTPFDMHIPLPSAQRSQSAIQRPQSAVQRADSSAIELKPYPDEYANDDIVTMLPGDSRARPFSWSMKNDIEAQNQHQQQQHQQQQHQQQQHQQQQHQQQGHQKTQSMYSSDAYKSGSVPRMGSMRKRDYPGISQVRKTSDGSAHLLTPRDFNAPLPDRIGDMVLDREIGEWVHISDYVHSSNNGSPATRGSPGGATETQTRGTSRGPASGRSSVSIHSHASAFPRPLPVAERSSGGPNTAYGMGLISPVENQRKIVHEMAERKAVKRDVSVRRRPIEDEALGSIVQRLMTPVASPDGCTALDLSGSGIRNLAGLSQITSRLESICLTGNKLQSLSGLPMGLVSLKAPSNWIRFNPTDNNRFMFARELPHLEEIDLSANEISDIGVFSELRHLRILELNRNRIESLRELCGCRRLLHLGLRDNILTTFDLEAGEAPLLTTLDMFNNRLRVVPASIGEFAHLVKVNMVKNDLERIEFHGPPAESIRELRLSENPLVMRRDGGVVDVRLWKTKFPIMKTLYLDICNIRKVAWFDIADDGTTIDNGRGPLSNPHTEDAAGWSSLFNLSLRGNALQPLLEIDFNTLKSLKNLYAPDTQMALPRALPQMNNLLQLVLYNAGLTHLPSNMGTALPQLRLLDVSNNPELADFLPILQLSSSLEVLKCRVVGFGSLSNVVVGGSGKSSEMEFQARFNSGANTGNQQSQSIDGDARTMLNWLSKLKRLRRLDFRFNKCTFELYAPPPAHGPSTSVGGAASLLDGALSPQITSPNVMGDGGGNAAGQSQPGMQGAMSGRIDEETWLRQDHAYLAGLKLSRQSKMIQRRDDYWITAISLFPRLEELDGIKVGLH
ncbi:Leucine-rich repeat protein [Coemansia sp. RSA 1358]|uniref:Leucine-rich repeat protein n=1 Tax=Coemansia umbellata TaxID=1424467 RepID=A0ABQ8PQQ3_9FUNG|nr:Leucine-rich repeat protein [Coemansia umbellata]KAJ2623629.1 Leucine-rich repeat protein [Coemansia sp. RSA 1358]